MKTQSEMIEIRLNESLILFSFYMELKSKGFILEVDDGEQVQPVADIPDLMFYHQNLDELRLIVYSETGKRIGSALFIFNNGAKGVHCLSDNSVSLEDLITRTTKLIEQLEG